MALLPEWERGATVLTWALQVNTNDEWEVVEFYIRRLMPEGNAAFMRKHGTVTTFEEFERVFDRRKAIEAVRDVSLFLQIFIKRLWERADGTIETAYLRDFEKLRQWCYSPLIGDGVANVPLVLSTLFQENPETSGAVPIMDDATISLKALQDNFTLLRRCPECDSLYIARPTKRQTIPQYCSQRCLNREWQRNKKREKRNVQKVA